ncbi:MAG: hypothetical protein JXA42_19320 [Anaerolineales bacterium]|nr:hypothetical protein [Anaerolineales bacterium]
MFHRLTQTERYWTKDLKVESDDLDNINNLLLEAEKPLSIDDLTIEVMRHRINLENNKLDKLLAQGTVYRPSQSYVVGEVLVFPALDFIVGRVSGSRPGSNPEMGQYQVIQVHFDHNSRTREFASDLQHPHALEKETLALLEPDHSLLKEEELVNRYGNHVKEALSAILAEQTELVEMYGFWFLKTLLTDIGLGYLNIAEAVLDVSGGGPSSTPELLQDLGLPEESRKELLHFSLNYALFNDERFDEVGPAGKVLWYLRRLEPAEVLYPPKRLEYNPVPYDRGLLNLNLRKLENELDDEWSNNWDPSIEPGDAAFTLTYPHLRQGTIPLSSSIAPLFPRSNQAPRIRCVIIDGHTDEEMEAWVVWEKRFVFGLKDWYKNNSLPMGAYIHLSQGTDPGVAIIRFEDRRAQREWIRVAHIQDNQLHFGMQKRAVACQYDDMMMIGMDDPATADQVWIKIQDRGYSLAHILTMLFPELARLSPQSTVHAKTVYSAVNMLYRCPPGPIFAELVRQPCFISMGENYWRFNPSLWTGG